MSEFKVIQSDIQNRFEAIENSIDTIKAEDLHKEMTELGRLIQKVSAVQATNAHGDPIVQFMKTVLERNNALMIKIQSRLTVLRAVMVNAERLTCYDEQIPSG